MEIEIQKYLYDVQQACELISEFTAGQSFESYQANLLISSPRLTTEVDQLLGETL